MTRHTTLRAAARVALALLALCAVGRAAAYGQGRRGGRTQGSKGARTTTAAARANGFIEEGDRRADAGDWAGALKFYEQAVAADPNHPDAHIYVGDAYMSLGKYVEAFAAYKEAVRVAPSNADAHYSLGAAYNDMAMYGDAFKPFVRAIGLNPNYAEAHYGIGYAYLKLDNFKDAVVYLRRAVGLRNDYPEAHLSLGLAYLGLGQTKAAEDERRLLEGMDAALAKDLEKRLREAGAVAARPEPGAGDKAASPEPPREPAAPAVTRPKVSAEGREAELALWGRIKDSTDTADFNGYLKTYPEGEFAGLARIRARLLKERGVAPFKSSAEPIGPPTPTPTPQIQADKATDKAPETAVETTTSVQPQPAAPRRGPTVEETLELLRDALANRFTYTATAPGQEAEVVKVTYEMVIEYVPRSFKSCRIEWRDRKETFSVSLSDLDSLSVKVEPRSRPNMTFSSPIWDVGVKTLDGAPAVRAVKSDGSGAATSYSDLVFQVDGKEKAERLARLLQQGIILCKSGP